MQHRRRLPQVLMMIGLLTIALLTSAPLTQAWAQSETDSPYFEASVLPPDLLSPPPAENTPQWQAEIAEVEAAQKHISPIDLAALRKEQHVRAELMTEGLGPDFDRAHLPATFHLLDRVLATTESVNGAAKRYYNTRRPYLTDQHIKLLVDSLDKSPAYPSGHTCASRTLAEVLGELMPQKRPELRARADEIARHRIQAGVHYPNDLQGGRTLAMMIIGALHANSDFLDDRDAARHELAAR